MEPPLLWVDMEFDRSPAELLWVDSPSWGKLNGQLLSLSYGYGEVSLIARSPEGNQAAILPLPLPRTPTGLMRGRFQPLTGDLFACGMYAWASSQTLQTGGLYRIRARSKSVHLPVEIRTQPGAITLVFSDRLDPESAQNTNNFLVKSWGYHRSIAYGSPRISERELAVVSARLASDGKTLELSVPELAATPAMMIAYHLTSADGQTVRSRLQTTIP